MRNLVLVFSALILSGCSPADIKDSLQEKFIKSEKAEVNQAKSENFDYPDYLPSDGPGLLKEFKVWSDRCGETEDDNQREMACDVAFIVYDKLIVAGYCQDEASYIWSEC